MGVTIQGHCRISNRRNLLDILQNEKIDTINLWRCHLEVSFFPLQNYLTTIRSFFKKELCTICAYHTQLPPTDWSSNVSEEKTTPNKTKCSLLPWSEISSGKQYFVVRMAQSTEEHNCSGRWSYNELATASSMNISSKCNYL